MTQLGEPTNSHFTNKVEMVSRELGNGANKWMGKGRGMVSGPWASHDN